MSINKSFLYCDSANDPRYAMSYDEIAKELEITPEEVKEIERSAINKLKHPRIGTILRKYVRM